MISSSSTDPKVLVGAQLLISVSWAAKNEVLGAHESSERNTTKGSTTAVKTDFDHDAQRVRTVSIDASNPPVEVPKTCQSPIPVSAVETGSRGTISVSPRKSTVPSDNPCDEASRRIRSTVKKPKGTGKKYYKSVFVGTHTKRKIRGVIKRKFSWKNYPELEDLLIKRRAEYLQISFTHNYTTYQKEYNNTLTEEVLDLAADLGYVFERFSFPQLRDRVRSYFKSYLQAVKKGRIPPN